MESPLPLNASRLPFNKFVCLLTAVAVIAGSGCSGVAPSTTAKSAAVGTAVGAGTGAIVGNNSSMGSGAGILGGAALGAITGGIIGMVQEAKDRKEQDRLSQERAYQQELAKKRSEEAKRKQAEDEELAIAQGARITELELNDAQKKTEDTSDRLKRLQNERAGYLARKKTLDELHEKQLSNEAEIARLEEELARLKGEDPNSRTGTSTTKKPDAAPASNGPSSSSATVKPGP